MDTLEDRFDMALVHVRPRIKHGDFAKKIGVTSEVLTKIKLGHLTGKAVLPEIVKNLGVPEDWLIHGTGPAPTWAPKPPPEHESLQKSMDLLLKMFSEQQAEIKALRQEVQILTTKKSSDTQSVKRQKIPLDLPESIPVSAP